MYFTSLVKYSFSEHAYFNPNIMRIFAPKDY